MTQPDDAPVEPLPTPVDAEGAVAAAIRAALAADRTLTVDGLMVHTALRECGYRLATLDAARVERDRDAVAGESHHCCGRCGIVGHCTHGYDSASPVDAVATGWRGYIRIRTPDDRDGWTAEGDIVPGVPYSYTSGNIAVWIDWHVATPTEQPRDDICQCGHTRPEHEGDNRTRVCRHRCLPPWKRPTEQPRDAAARAAAPDGLREALTFEPDIAPQPKGKITRKWWRLGWLSALAVARDRALTDDRP